jgi:flagellar biosynthesis/type III secretory pathway protein FliH
LTEKAQVALCNLQSLFDTVMESVATFWKEKNDFLHRRGLHRGQERGLQEDLEKGLQKGLQEGKEKNEQEKRAEVKRTKTAVVTNLLQQTDFGNNRIAQIAEVSVAYQA